MDRPPFDAHDNAPFTLPAETAAKIAAYEAGGVQPEPDAVPVLEAREVSKDFGRVIALDKVSLSVRPGVPEEIERAKRFIRLARQIRTGQ